MFKNLLKQNNGFTMIELLVSISVFAIIVAIVSGIFITSLRSNRTSISLISANSDGQLALEQMTRMIRKGQGSSFLVEEVDINNSPTLDPIELKYKCLRFTYGGKFITYRWDKDGKKLEVSIVENLPLRCNDSGGGSKVFNEIISENLRADFVDFRIIGRGEKYPLITIVLRVGAKKTLITSGGQSFINLQTSISPRSDNRY
ncbi:MAG: PilW family protein [Minisyncoccota bacterium]